MRTKSIIGIGTNLYNGNLTMCVNCKCHIPRLAANYLINKNNQKKVQRCMVTYSLYCNAVYNRKKIGLNTRNKNFKTNFL